MAKPHCYPAKTGYGCPALSARDGRSARIILICTCSETPLRTAGRDRRLPGLRGRNLLDEIFLDVAEDEMEHYAETMRLISWLDPVQAEMLEEALDVLVMKRPIGKPKWATAKKAPEAADVAVPPGKKDLPAVQSSPRPYKMNCMP